MVDLPAPLGPTMATVLPAGTCEADVLQDRPARVVAEVHVLEDDLAALGCKWHGAPGLSVTSGPDVEQVEHDLHVDQGLLDLAVDRAEQAERHGQLHQVGVDHDEVAHGHGAGATP